VLLWSRADIVQAALTRRLRETNHNTVALSLSLAEACMKNCRKFTVAVKKPLMDEVVIIARGSKGVKNQAEALRLVKQWDGLVAKRGDDNSIFHDTYLLLKSRGAVFPVGPSDDNVPDRSVLGSLLYTCMLRYLIYSMLSQR
jgi:hypothetical protein